MAERVGVMVGDRVLTKDYVRDEIARIDFADLLARGAERVSRADLEAVTAHGRALGGGAAHAGRHRRAARARPAGPRARAAGAAARAGHARSRAARAGISGSSTAASPVLAEALERPDFRTRSAS